MKGLLRYRYFIADERYNQCAVKYLCVNNVEIGKKIWRHVVETEQDIRVDISPRRESR